MKAKTQSNSQDVINDLLSLIQPTTEQPRLQRERPKGPLSAARGYAEDNALQVPLPPGDAGIAFPLVEVNYSNRQYSSAGLPSTDGLFIYPLLTRIELKDANDETGFVYLAGTTPPVTP